ncbi:MAG: flagellar type III secretion system pore protein FliP [Micavibrio sp.]
MFKKRVTAENTKANGVAESARKLPRKQQRRPASCRPLLAALAILASLAAILHASPALAQAITLDLGGEETGTVSGRIIQMVALLTILSLAPSILIMMTSFTRIIVVLSFLRTAMGIQQTPPNTVIISLALFLTFFIMSPTLKAAYDNGVQPLINAEIDEVQAFERTTAPFHQFMIHHVREKDLILFTELSDSGPYEEQADVPLHVLIPAFMISELRRAFEIGFMIFLPFIIIDMVTASILMSMGMMMLPPVMISLPFKIVFFVLVDGWYLICGSLIQSFNTMPITPSG